MGILFMGQEGEFFYLLAKPTEFPHSHISHLRCLYELNQIAVGD
jgi:hypothetical protein